MKEMTIKQKAKAYNKAIAHAKTLLKIIGNATLGNLVLKNEFEIMFPALKESNNEKDKCMLNNIIDTLRPLSETTHSGYAINSMIAWLKKQGEHKKFRDSIQVGDKVTRNEDGVLVNLSQLKRVAKPVEPMIVGQEPLYDYTNANICQKDFSEQKPAWSEEDKDFMCDTLSNLTELKDRYGEEYGNVGKCIDWLKSLKDRVQPKQEWSEEDESRLDIIFERIERGLIVDKDDIDRLKSLKERCNWKPSDEQMKALWEIYEGGEKQSALSSLYNDLKHLKQL